MTRYLLNFGDSWAHGEGGSERQNSNYVHQLSLATNRTVIDLSQPSTSAAYMVLQFRRFVQDLYQPEHDYLAVFFITAQERQLAFDSAGQPQEIHPQDSAYQQYYQSVYTDHLGEFVVNSVILTLQSLSAHYNIDDRYLLGWQHLDLWPEIDRNRFYNQAQTTAMNLLGNTIIEDCGHNGNVNFIPGDGHPSVAGHTEIARSLAAWILTTHANTI